MRQTFILKLIKPTALVALIVFGITSCTVTYRERHRRPPPPPPVEEKIIIKP